MKKKVFAILAAGALTALTATSAMAFENEFHGMYKFMGYYGNFFNGLSGVLGQTVTDGFMAEQRARLQYIAKANDNLKLVTHFELDSRFGGINPAANGGYKGTSTGNDSGYLDADSLTLETKSIYLDFNDTALTNANFKVGLQPWADSYQSLFLLADMTGAYMTKKFDPLTLSLGWFRYNDKTLTAATQPGDKTADLYVLDGKFAATKDMTFGLSWYQVMDSTGETTATTFDKLSVVGVNAALNFDPVLINPFAAYQFGDAGTSKKISAYMLGTTAKVKVGSTGAVNLAAVYLSGDKDNTGKSTSWHTVAAATTYFNAANMWLLVRTGQAINSSTSVLGNDLTVGGRGIALVTGGYEGKAGKIFYNANVGYAQVAQERTNEIGTLGTELNAQVGYKLYDNLDVSLAGGYMFLGKGLNGGTGTGRISGFGAASADDPYFTNVQLSYTF